MDTLECIFKRRSVRKYKPDPVKDQDLAQILEAIRWAPSWTNIQPWEVVVVRDEAMKKKLQEAVPDGNPAKKSVVTAPVLLVMIGKKGVSGAYKGQMATSLGDWVMFDMGIACQNACLAACALGLGTVHLGLLNHELANKILGLPPDMTVFEYIPIGYPDHEPKVQPRKELHQFVHYDKYEKK